MRFTNFKHNIKQLLISLDQCVCCLIGLILSIIGLIIPKLSIQVWADETFSSLCYRWSLKGIKWPMRIVDTIFIVFNDVDHCKNSYISELERNQLPVEFRNIGS